MPAPDLDRTATFELTFAQTQLFFEKPIRESRLVLIVPKPRSMALLEVVKVTPASVANVRPCDYLSGNDCRA
jgi:hypothetical protein